MIGCSCDVGGCSSCCVVGVVVVVGGDAGAVGCGCCCGVPYRCLMSCC